MNGMIDYAKDKTEKRKVLKKLLAKWIAAQDTKGKAAIIMAKNPDIRNAKRPENQKRA